MLLSLCVIMGKTNIAVFAESNSTKAEDAQTVSVFSNDVSQNSVGWNGVTMESTFEGNGFQVTFKLEDYWNGGYNANVKIENTGDTLIENWTIKFDYPGEIATVWNAVIDTRETGKYVVKNAGWNQDIASGQSVEFGISGQGDFVGFPSEYQMLGHLVNADGEDYSIDFKETSKWDSGFNANITITNNTDKDIEDWVLEFDFDADITDIWDGDIISKGNGHYVVKNVEYNSTIPSGKSVSFGIQGCYYGTTCELSNCQLSSYNSQTSGEIVDSTNCDMTIVQNAYSNIKIGYANGDDQYSVTSDLSLRTELEGATITWISNNPEVISETGKVVRSDKTKNVTLTAVISSNDYSMRIAFDVRVIKNTYVDYNTDLIYDMDSLELLYIYNDNPDDLEVYLTDGGYIDELNGKFSEILVESPEEAILALYEVKSLMGCENPKEQLEWVKTNKNQNGYSYSFHQIVDGIPVYGRNIVVSTDLEGTTTSLHSSLLTDVNVDLENVITESEVKTIIENNGYRIIESKGLVIYSKDDTYLAYNVECQKGSLLYNILVDASNGNILLTNLRTISETIEQTGDDVFGNPYTFTVNKEEPFWFFEDTKYNINDYKRNIYYYDVEGKDSDDWFALPGRNISKSTNTWSAEEISALVSMEKVYDFYENSFGRRGYDNERGKFSMCINIGDYSSFSSGSLIAFSRANESYTIAAQAGVDTVGHEFTHSVVDSDTDLGTFYQDAPGAINEGYADIFGYFTEGDEDPDWNHGEDNHASPIRVMSNPNSRNMPERIGDWYYVNYTEIPSDAEHDYGGVHTNNSIVSYPCYLMWVNGISDKARLANLWYSSLRYGYDSSSTFNDVRLNVLRAAKAMGMSGEEIEIIKDAFDSVGIEGENSADISGTNVLFGKIVVADEDMITGNNRPLSMASVSLKRQGTVRPFENTSASDGTFKFYDLYPGTYTLTVSSFGYISIEQEIILTAANITTYCDTIELIPLSYFGQGIAKGTVVDSVTGNGVEGLTLKVRSGMNTKTGTIVSTTTTDEHGEYELSLDAGLYCVEVTDNRELESVEEKYYITYLNIKVLGQITIENQNATVSNSLDIDQVRIVLEWGASPRDLDSHLIGPTSSGSDFHIYYGSKTYNESGIKIADLDLDDTSSYGPETTTIYNPIEGEYIFYVQNYSGSPDITSSGATVKVFMGRSNAPAYSFSVPLTGTGKYWTVFTYDSKKRRITPVNIVSTAPII